MAVQKRLCWVLNTLGACGLGLAMSVTIFLGREARASAAVPIEELGGRRPMPVATWDATALPVPSWEVAGMLACGAIGIGGVVAQVRRMHPHA